ncbi:16S rRNA (guanine(966)-N(2))-methyltransferase RsmD [Nakamurella antarctica]|uniref:16S rRNA (Guanine(966)-N(2))-methyltransferase RsmD n=1 Tax=Nakamurella antarctica TaxID=1902245 RepID=A0A3G8ZN88_9ACTN|nr:16S rRNA (guanine(966)-N(2))-methyltransferase RsmD [Nakamurella antarctica]AZI58267.1 16S rRNA (guanine(966)-N(2))-methyltransferase RsmD [Nakamurella antarctica]
MTRVVAGQWGGRTLATPEGPHTRPTSEKVRAAMANSLQAAGALAGANVLDLFAGSGGLGLELASRGAASVVLVDNDRAAVAAARANVEKLQATSVRVVPASAADYVATAVGTTKFDIVVADPPYPLTTQELAQILSILLERGLLNPGADLVVERPKRAGEMVWPDPMVGLRTKKYGDTLLCYGRAP